MANDIFWFLKVAGSYTGIAWIIAPFLWGGANTSTIIVGGGIFVIGQIFGVIEAATKPKTGSIMWGRSGTPDNHFLKSNHRK